MSPIRYFSLFTSLLLTANAAAAPLFSPYADITINTHWDARVQDLAPMDLTTPTAD